MFKIETLEGIEITCSENISILDNALNAGYIFDYSCKKGVCGACKTTLLKGEVHELNVQRALSVNDKNNNQFLSCCCAPKSDIIIDAEELGDLKCIKIKTLPVRINSLVKYSDSIMAVELRIPPTEDFKFLEGQHIDVIGPNGIRRIYSIANCRDEPFIQLLVKKIDGGAFSKYWFDTAKENDLLRIEGPKGSFYFRSAAKRVVFLATGTGIAPIKAILNKLDNESDKYSNILFSLYWGNRKEEDFFWIPIYKSINLEYVPVLSMENSSWQGDFGYVQDYAMRNIEREDDIDIYACGSLQMINSVHKIFSEHGLIDNNFYLDAFVES